MFPNFIFLFHPPSPKASQRERQAALYRRSGAAEEAAQEGLPRLQIPAAAPQKWKARFQFRKWGRQPFGGWGQPQPVPLQTCPPGSGPRWGSRVPSVRWAPPSCCRWAAGSLPQTPLNVIVCSVCRGGDGPFSVQFQFTSVHLYIAKSQHLLSHGTVHKKSNR